MKIMVTKIVVESDDNDDVMQLIKKQLTNSPWLSFAFLLFNILVKH